MDYYLAITYQLPNLAHYRYCYLMHDVVRCIYHVIMISTGFMRHEMYDDYYWVSTNEIHKTHATYY